MSTADPIASLSIEALWDASVDGLLVASVDGTVTATNAALDALFGYRRGELVGRPVEILIPDAQRGVHVQHRAEFARDPRARPMAARNFDGMRKDGSRFSVNISLAPVQTDAGPAIFAAVRDLSDRVAHEQALAEAHRRRAIAEDHDRIAKDLHDSVIQRLFALGLGLQGLPARIEDPRVADRVSAAVDTLDDIIHDIRTTIYGLRETATSHQSLRSIVLALAHEAEPNLGFVPDVSLSGSIDRVTDDSLIGHIVSVVREALSNAGRHAEATEVTVHLTLDHHLTIEVSDNGKGIDLGNARRSGLANMANRAAAYGGTFDIGGNERGGTTVRWSIPEDQIV